VDTPMPRSPLENSQFEDLFSKCTTLVAFTIFCLGEENLIQELTSTEAQANRIKGVKDFIKLKSLNIEWFLIW
jgi:hypothetical protein